MGRTKGRLNTKIHAVVNARSQPIVIALSSGNEADISLLYHSPQSSTGVVIG
jgi:hypothetical protein